MDSFAGRLAVVTGGGSGMGRELVVQLATDGCSVATCDVDEGRLAETVQRAEKDAPSGTRVTAHGCDVADERQVVAFRDAVLTAHETDHVDLLFNNAGIGGGGSFVHDDRAQWERVFAIDWWGVYYCSRAFVPLLIASEDAYLVNTSSVNGFWASLGPGLPHTAYSAAKFAVKGFTEALITDFRLNAPHVKVAVVMPGHIGTDIVVNSQRIHGASDPDEMTAEELAEVRSGLTRSGMTAADISDDQLREGIRAMGEAFRNNAPLSAAGAATIILDGVRAGRWRILVGDDAHRLDEAVRANPERAYEPGGPSMPGMFG